MDDDDGWTGRNFLLCISNPMSDRDDNVCITVYYTYTYSYMYIQYIQSICNMYICFIWDFSHFLDLGRVFPSLPKQSKETPNQAIQGVTEAGNPRGHWSRRFQGVTKAGDPGRHWSRRSNETLKQTIQGETESGDPRGHCSRQSKREKGRYG